MVFAHVHPKKSCCTIEADHSEYRHRRFGLVEKEAVKHFKPFVILLNGNKNLKQDKKSKNIDQKIIFKKKKLKELMPAEFLLR